MNTKLKLVKYEVRKFLTQKKNSFPARVTAYCVSNALLTKQSFIYFKLIFHSAVSLSPCELSVPSGSLW